MCASSAFFEERGPQSHGNESGLSGAEQYLERFLLPTEFLKKVYGKTFEDAEMRARDTSGRIAYYGGTNKGQQQYQQNHAETFGVVTEAAVGYLLAEALGKKARVIKTTDPDDHKGVDFVIELDAPPPNLLAIDVTHGSKNLYDSKLADVDHDAQYGIMREVRFFIPHFSSKSPPGRRATYLMPRLIVGFDRAFAESCSARPIWNTHAHGTDAPISARARMLLREIKLGLYAQLATAKRHGKDQTPYRHLIKLFPSDSSDDVFGPALEPDAVYEQIRMWAQGSVQEGLRKVA